MTTPLRRSDRSLRVVEAIRAAIGPAPAVLHEPTFRGREWEYVKECLDTGWVSSVGAFVRRFETDLCAATGARHAVVMANGTAALQVALMVAGVRAGDEVVVPALTFVGTAAAVRHCSAVPLLADVSPVTLGLDPAALDRWLQGHATRTAEGCLHRQTGRIIRAVVPMHTFGHPVDIAALLSVAQAWSLVVVEDAAESLGSWVGDRHTGTFGLVGTLSFNGNKTVTTGGGGALLTNDDTLAAHARHLTTTAKLPHRWAFIHDDVGFNYRMPNLNAALGCAQLEQLPTLLEAKRQLFERYHAAFADAGVGTIVREPAGCRSNYWLQTLLLDPAVTVDDREDVLQATNDAGYGTRPAWTPLHHLTPYADCPTTELPETEQLARRIVNLPSSPPLVEREPVA